MRGAHSQLRVFRTFARRKLKIEQSTRWRHSARVIFLCADAAVVFAAAAAAAVAAASNVVVFVLAGCWMNHCSSRQRRDDGNDIVLGVMPDIYTIHRWAAWKKQNKHQHMVHSVDNRTL